MNPEIVNGYKSARDHRQLPVLDGNPLDFKTVLAIMHEHQATYVAIELDAIEDERQIYRNLEASVDHLVSSGLVSIR